MIRGLFLVAISAVGFTAGIGGHGPLDHIGGGIGAVYGEIESFSAKPTRPTPPAPEGSSSGPVGISVNPKDMPLRVDWWSGLCATGSAASAPGAVYRWVVDPAFADKVEIVGADTANARIRAKAGLVGDVPVRLVVSQKTGEASASLNSANGDDTPPPFPPSDKPTDPTTSPAAPTKPTTTESSTTSSTTKSTTANKPSGNADPWKLGTSYKPGALAVGSDGKTYKCKDFPMSGWCGVAEVYKPVSGAAWGDAWDVAA